MHVYVTCEETEERTQTYKAQCNLIMKDTCVLFSQAPYDFFTCIKCPG